ncbi:MAG TPA: Rieske 2Fe-2S domain-containing protein [Dehalococcoidia bacterium]|nr:Rieske 2Fe-2S domain-containing protein [Dehalococcoidia bacterium]
MLTAADNATLTRVGPGTLMGNLLRRYWMPALLSSEVAEPDSPPVRVRLLGEDLIAFRDTNGDAGIVANACPHRGASLFFGRNEEAGLRCVYHGWKFDTTGACIDMPSEPAESNFKTKVRVAAYPTHESGGIVWTYMGPPEKRPVFRDFGSEALKPEQIRASKVFVECNWVQSMEGNLDTSHISWLHHYHAASEIPDDGSDGPGVPSNAMSIRIWEHDRAPRIEVQAEWYGHRYAGLRSTPNGNTHVRVTAYIFPFTTVVAAIPLGIGAGGGLFVPIDDEHCWRFGLSVQPPAFDRPAHIGPPLFSLMPYSFERPDNGISPRAFNASNDYQVDREAQRGVSFSGIPDFVSQDHAVQESMGRVMDRTHEHLGTTDRAVIRMRQQLLSAARDMEQGIDPPALDGSLDYAHIYGAERILAPAEDWRRLGTAGDPIFQRPAAVPAQP